MADPVSETRSKEYDWAQLVREEEAKEAKPYVPIAYIFNAGKRKFEDPGINGGVYAL